MTRRKRGRKCSITCAHCRTANSAVEWRAERELAALAQHVARSTAKLANAEFVQKAPAVVVEKERARLAEWEAKRVATAGKLEGLRERARITPQARA
ncbi:MAG: hypothetical protein OD918_06920 [Gammaproteobacteria bacterium]